jgi:hypothetical protein
MPHTETSRRITIGVDTHADAHVAVALDQRGARLDELHIPTAQAGHTDLERWAVGLGPINAFGVEGTVPTAPSRSPSWRRSADRTWAYPVRSRRMFDERASYSDHHHGVYAGQRAENYVGSRVTSVPQEIGISKSNRRAWPC